MQTVSHRQQQTGHSTSVGLFELLMPTVRGGQVCKHFRGLGGFSCCTFTHPVCSVACKAEALVAAACLTTGGNVHISRGCKGLLWYPLSSLCCYWGPIFDPLCLVATRAPPNTEHEVNQPKWTCTAYCYTFPLSLLPAQVMSETCRQWVASGAWNAACRLHCGYSGNQSKAPGNTLC